MKRFVISGILMLIAWSGWTQVNVYRISDGTRRNRIRAGRLPAPDGHIARRPFWYESTIRQHQPEPAGGDA